MSPRAGRRLALLTALAAAAEDALLQASEGYASGWRATHMIDTPVRGVEGEDTAEEGAAAGEGSAPGSEER